MRLPLFKKAKNEMAVYHFSVKIISRSTGRSSVAAAAYRHADKLIDERLGVHHDYTRKQHVEHSAILSPEGAPNWVADRSSLWNAVEKSEKRKDARLSREVEVALPRELSKEDRIDLVKQFAQEQFVDRGMIADIAVHNPTSEDGQEQPHAHIMLTTRPLDGNKFSSKKDRSWNDKEKLESWRESWSEIVNHRLELHGQKSRIDHRSYKDQGVDKVPQLKLGPAVTQMERRGVKTDRGNINRLRSRFNEALEQARQGVGQFTDRAKELFGGLDLQDIEKKLSLRNVDKILKSRAEKKKARPQKKPSKGMEM